MMPTYDHGVAGLTGTIGVTILNADATVHTARATAGITEPVAGSGVYHVAHPAVGTLLGFVFDGGVGTVGASVWSDGLSITTVNAKTTNLPAVPASKADADAATSAANAAEASADAAARPGATMVPSVLPLDAAATRAAVAAEIAAAEAPPAGYTRVTSATYGTLRAGSVIDAYAPADTTYSTPLVDNAVAASNGTWAIDLPDDGTYVLVARLVGYDDVTTEVTV
jgi:hypothetical protein